MTRSKPPCPKCSSTQNVRTLGGGSINMYRYKCESDDCDGITWQQIPPSVYGVGSATIHRPQLISKRKSVVGTSYKCSKCGLIKKGHTCMNDVSKEYKDMVKSAETLQVVCDNGFVPASSSISVGETPSLPFSEYGNLPMP